MARSNLVRLCDYRLAAGAESYPQRVSHYDEDDFYEEDERQPAPTYPQTPPQVDYRAEMGERLRAWGVGDWRRFLREADPVLLAQTITTVEDAVAEGGVKSAGGLFRWSMRQAGFRC